MNERAADKVHRALRRRLDQVFGDVLPETSLDERAGGTAEEGTGADRWYRENRPPHHDG